MNTVDSHPDHEYTRMSQRTYVLLPDLDDQPVLDPAQKAMLSHVQRSDAEQKLILRRWYADQAMTRTRAAPLKSHRIVRSAQH